MRILVLLALSAAFCLQPVMAAKTRYSSVGQSAVYACSDGRTVEVLYAGGDAVALTIAGRSVELDRAASTDGERYIGGGLQWWGKGARDGLLSPLVGDERVASAPGTACRIR